MYPAGSQCLVIDLQCALLFSVITLFLCGLYISLSFTLQMEADVCKEVRESCETNKAEFNEEVSITLSEVSIELS